MATWSRLVDDLLRRLADRARQDRAARERPIELAAAVAQAIEMASPLFEQREHR